MPQQAYTKVRAVGVYLPQSYTNQELIDRTGINSSDTWISERTGIRRRGIASAEESNASMAVQASIYAINEASEKGRGKPELIILATNTTVGLAESGAGFPCAAGMVQAGLEGLVEPNCGFTDLNSGCTGINYALAFADSIIKSGMYRTILVIGSDKLSDIVDFRQRETSVLFSDGATAYVLSASKYPGFIGYDLHGDGKQRHIITSPVRERLPFRGETVERGPTVVMEGRAVYKAAVGLLVTIAEEFQENDRLNPEHLSFMGLRAINPHQSNRRILEHASREIAEKLTAKYGVPVTAEDVFSKFEITIQDHGNSSTASPGPGFENLRRTLQRGDHVLMIGMGSGFSWGANHYIF
ncbi:hypothetical protein HYW21_01045 [Candidatus Woesearchaeota archaeon]|nr:hypothetical protein [Candidatus Woesearchaeota archaeon]